MELKDIAGKIREFRDERDWAQFMNAVPIFDNKIAAGEVSKEQWLQDYQFAELPEHLDAKPGFFLAQIVGESMSRRIPNGSRCLFREPSDGSRKFNMTPFASLAKFFPIYPLNLLKLKTHESPAGH